MVNGISRGHMFRCMLLRIKGGEKKMDNKTSIAVISALKYKLQNEDCKINLPKSTYAKALRNSLIRLR